jgi:hypothetical protein
VDFDDFNCKLLVLEELCFHREVLPPFDQGDLGADGSEPLDAAVAYYRDLAVPQGLLAQVTELGLDGGHRIYQSVWPYWDGEDDFFDVTTYGDFAKLPALARVWSTSRLPGELRALLKARGVEIGD